MEEKEKSLIKQQAWEAAPKKHLACLFYALFYTICLYHNRSGILIPFFTGASIFFFGCYFKRYGATAGKESRFWVLALILLGASSATTDSAVLISLNRGFTLVLWAVWLLQLAVGEQAGKWRTVRWCREICGVFWGSLLGVGAPIADAVAYKKEHTQTSQETFLNAEHRRIVRAVLIGLALSIPLLSIAAVLLFCADAVFHDIFVRLLRTLTSFELPAWLYNGEVIGILCMVVGVFFYSYGMLAWFGIRRSRCEKEQQEKEYGFDTYIAITAAALVTALYLLFCGVQVFGLFLGRLQLPAGYTYAEYARSGFFPLLFVCIFNSCLVPAALALFKASRVLRHLLTAICGCTFVMIASSAYRMLLYIGTYSMTFLRFAVLWTLAVMVVLTAGIIYKIYHERFRLSGYLLVTVTCGYLAFALIHPDYWIARYDIYALEKGEAADTYYLYARLSADAAPAIASLDMTQCADEEYAESGAALRRAYFQRIRQAGKEQTWRTWNLSRAIAAAYDKADVN